ncbi:MAG: hypothetical protein A2Y58_04580 [Chloroflexi bacterium RBG_13_51_52]|nr:MAG: hypothetical protein A2Y58_04580 [Chloroflexi bacterium RBG_13_51_52]
MTVKSIVFKHINVYRVITALGLVAAVILVLAITAQMSGASPWAYYYGVKNFSEGKLVIDDQLHNQQVREAGRQGGILVQYVEVSNGRWAVEKAPGYIFYLVPFEWLGIPRWGNVLLAAGMVIVMYLLLKRLRDEETACIGSLLMLFTPIGLIMFNRAYMDTFASLAFLAMGGGLYFYYQLERNKYRPLTGSLMLFLAFLVIGWSVVTRQSNLLVAIILALHFAITRIVAFYKGERVRLTWEIPSVAAGAGIAMAVLMIYNNYVFGSPLDYGYNYTRFPVNFAYQYLGQVTADGQSLPLKIIIENLKSVPIPLIEGFPLLVIGIPGIGAVLYFKLFHKKDNPAGRWSSLRNELPWGTLLVMIGWFLSVYLLYMTYEFTAEYLRSDSSFFRYSRYYLPGLFPVGIVCSLIIARFPRKLSIPLMTAIIAAGVVLYYQVALNPRA